MGNRATGEHAVLLSHRAIEEPDVDVRDPVTGQGVIGQERAEPGSPGLALAVLGELLAQEIVGAVEDGKHPSIGVGLRRDARR